MPRTLFVSPVLPGGRYVVERRPQPGSFFHRHAGLWAQVRPVLDKAPQPVVPLHGLRVPAGVSLRSVLRDTHRPQRPDLDATAVAADSDEAAEAAGPAPIAGPMHLFDDLDIAGHPARAQVSTPTSTEHPRLTVPRSPFAVFLETNADTMRGVPFPDRGRMLGARWRALEDGARRRFTDAATRLSAFPRTHRPARPFRPHVFTAAPPKTPAVDAAEVCPRQARAAAVRASAPTPLGVSWAAVEKPARRPMKKRAVKAVRVAPGRVAVLGHEYDLGALVPPGPLCPRQPSKKSKANKAPRRKPAAPK